MANEENSLVRFLYFFSKHVTFILRYRQSALENTLTLHCRYCYFDITVELQWLEHLWDYENMFGTGVVRANEC